uniref:Uncharacterized protein n=1 Tax=Panagrolaimus superbus TaxID=310955 RepID=A0A914YJS8_9BILA
MIGRIHLTSLLNLNIAAVGVARVAEGIARTLEGLCRALGTGEQVLPRTVFGIGKAKQSIQRTFHHRGQGAAIRVGHGAGRGFHQTGLHALQLQVDGIEQVFFLTQGTHGHFTVFTVTLVHGLGLGQINSLGRGQRIIRWGDHALLRAHLLKNPHQIGLLLVDRSQARLKKEKN